MASIFKQQYTVTKDGRKIKRRSKRWYVEYLDADGVRRRVAGYADKTATRQFAAKLEREAEQVKAGLVDRYAQHRKRPLAEHLDEFHAALVAKGTTR